MNAHRNRRVRRVAAWVALAVTLIAAPGSAVACGCLPRTGEPESACVHCGPHAVPDAGARLERASCCGARTVQQAPAIAATPVALERSASASPLPPIAPGYDAPALALAAATGRAPPSAFATNAPPTPYLQNFLRL